MPSRDHSNLSSSGLAVDTDLCRLHVTFHGCSMYATHHKFGMAYLMRTGFWRWAATNRIVVLYPQMRACPGAAWGLRHGCWDAEGATGQDYSLRSGPQMWAVWQMVTALLQGRG